MLIEQFIGATGPMIVVRTLRFGPAKSRTIDVGELCGCFPLRPFLETSQIDHIHHYEHPLSTKSATGVA
jgi:hypothetical protein